MNTIRHASNTAWAFLWTEMKPEAKPYLLAVADRILNPIAYTEIDSRGFPVSITREISPEYNCLQNSDYSLYNTISSIGVGIFGAYLFTGSLSKILFESNFSTFLTFTCVSFSARIIYEKLINFTDSNFKVGTAHNIKIVAFAALSVLSAMTMTFYIIATSSTILTCLHTFSITPILMLASNSIKLFAFNFFAGAFLKLIAYKLYSRVQSAYNNFFTFLKAGEVDPRNNGDLALSNSFKNHSSILYNIPLPDLLPIIRHYLPSKEALHFRQCSKSLFSLTFNRDILKMRICENFIFSSAKMNETETEQELRKEQTKKIKSFILERLCTYPILHVGPNSNLRVPDTHLTNSTKWFWTKSSKTTYIIEIPKKDLGKPRFFQDFSTVNIDDLG